MNTPRSESTPAVELKNVGRWHRKHRETVIALDDVSVSFDVASFTAVMGVSGSGKSTFLQCASGLDRPDIGRVHIEGVNLADLRETDRTRLRRERIGFIFQSFNLLPSLTAAQNIALPLWIAGRRPRKEQIEEALAAVSLSDRARHRPSEMSGGQQQRVAVARALILQPAVIFADEPTGALDGPNATGLLDLLTTLHRGNGRTIVLVTHDPVAAARAERVIFLSHGRVARILFQPTIEAISTIMAGLPTHPADLHA